MKPIIRVDNVGKQYVIGSRQGYETARDAITQALQRPFRKNSGPKRETIWALRDVSFDAAPGDLIGIIGRNGAGKSTLLKILSRITEPTTGRVELRGRVGSLLEVGTGFHPELTGRENVYLNGAVLGMKRSEVKQKFDEIVSFAEVERFIDTPIKRYSSGMYLRLAFAVAAHFESEILIVDEVLAVGDVAFQKKCLGRMSEVSRGGRTVLFVSHNMGAVQQLTTKAVVLHQGNVQFVGNTQSAIEHYTSISAQVGTGVYEVGRDGRRLPGLSNAVEFVRLELGNKSSSILAADQDLTILATLNGNESVHNFRLSMTIFSADGTPVGSTFGPENLSIQKGCRSVYQLRLGSLHLAPGSYYCGLAVGKGNHLSGHTDFDVILDVVHFEVLAPEGIAGTRSHWTPGWGAIRFPEPATGELHGALN
jgi:lipopolysaccharide transport system ATP-binding protein